MEEKRNIPQDLEPIQISAKINAPIEKVWEAITKPSLLKQWFAAIDLDELQDGDTFTFLEMFGDQQMLHECLILEMDEPNLFRHTWAYADLSQASSTVNWDLEKDGNQTEVIITHESIHQVALDLPDLTPERLTGFWEVSLNQNLKKFLER